MFTLLTADNEKRAITTKAAMPFCCGAIFAAPTFSGCTAARRRVWGTAVAVWMPCRDPASSGWRRQNNVTPKVEEKHSLACASSISVHLSVRFLESHALGSYVDLVLYSVKVMSYETISGRRTVVQCTHVYFIFCTRGRSFAPPCVSRLPLLVIWFSELCNKTLY
jgi:hypothetical protein